MSIRKVLFGLLLLGSLTVSAQDWSLGLDLISLGKVIGGEETPAVLQIRRSFNERHAVRVNLGAYHSEKRRDWVYFNTVKGIYVLNNMYDEINYVYSGRLGWEYSFLRREDRFRLYAYSGVLLGASKNKSKRNALDSIPSIKMPWEGVLLYYRPEYNNYRISSGVFLIPGVEVNLTPRFSLALESEITGRWYKDYRYELISGWKFDWNSPNRSEFFVDDGHEYDEKGFEFKANPVQYLFLRYSF